MLLAAVVTAVVAGGAPACGGSDDESETAAGAAHRDGRQGDARGSPQERKPVAPGRKGRKPVDGHGALVDRPVLSGNTKQARAGALAVDDAYLSLAGAVDSGVAAVDVAVADTLWAAEGSDGLAKLCELMSHEATRQTILYAQRASNLDGVDWTCEKATALLLRRTRQSKGLEQTLQAEVVGVNADGNRATATVRFGGRNGRLSTIPLIKEDGRWKLGSSLGGEG